MKFYASKVAFFSAALFLSSCETEIKTDNTTSEKQETSTIMTNDIHSRSNYEEANTTHLHLDLTANFEQKKLIGLATHTINNRGANNITFDINDLVITKVTLDNNKETTFTVGDSNKILGEILDVSISPNTKKVTIFYETKPSSAAVQWLSRQQTAYKKYPFLFTQGEPILTRSWIPIQDSPGNKITYSATIKVPDSLTAVMSAEKVELAHKENGVFKFNLEQPIPSYLIALAIGKLDYKSLGERSGVYAEPNMIDACVYEFQDIEKMMEAAENLYGEYAWGQYDVIVLPPSFPFGGMENPRLTFATPTIIAGDRSLTALIAHELAHSWSGNLATNSTWSDFWLNEGFTVYFERRITEELYGKEYAEMLALLGFQDLTHSVNHLDSNDTRLKIDLEDRNPDDGMTDIAYEKGYFLLRLIEETVGREEFDDFLKKYFKHFEFKNLNTEEFIAYIEEKLPEVKKLNLNEWIYESGIPANCPKVISNKFDIVDKAHQYKPNEFANVVGLNPEKWTTHEWLHYIRGIDVDKWKNNNLFELADKAYNFTTSGNSEIATAWYEKSILGGYTTVNDELEKFLIRVGRRKFLEPLYKALVKSNNEELALNIYKKARPNYHSVSSNTIDKLLNYKN